MNSIIDEISYSSLPVPPKNFAVSFEVKAMYLSYKDFMDGNEKLTSMAYFCLTTLEISADGRGGAAKKYSISRRLLDKVGELCTKGDFREARKMTEGSIPLTTKEKTWLPVVISRLIEMAGEINSSPAGILKKITLDDFEKL